MKSTALSLSQRVHGSAGIYSTLMTFNAISIHKYTGIQQGMYYFLEIHGIILKPLLYTC
jgi:hypothetical protein